MMDTNSCRVRQLHLQLLHGCPEVTDERSHVLLRHADALLQHMTARSCSSRCFSYHDQPHIHPVHLP